MLHNNSNTTYTNQQMPGGISDSIPQEDTQFNQQGNANLNDHTGQKIVGGPKKIQAGLDHAMSNEHKVNNNSSLNHENAGFAQTSGLNDNITHNPLHSSHETIPSNVDGHRNLQSHHKGLGNLNSRHDLAGNELNNQDPPLSSNTQQTHFGSVNSFNPSNEPSHNNEHHYGRDAALGAGAAGLAKHELGNHHGKSTSGDPLNSSHGSNPLSHDSRTEHSPISRTHDNEHLYGRDAALGAGAAGLAKHELGNHHGKSTSGDPLNSSHGSNPLSHDSRTERSPISNSSENKHHYGRDAALGAGAAGLAKHELDNHHGKSTSGDPLNSSHGSNPLSHDSRTEHSPISKSRDNEHHYGRDAALGAGAAGLAKHELDHHHDNTGSNLNSSQDTSPLAHKEHSPVSRKDNNETHHGRNAALAGAAGVAGREIEHNHDEKRRNSVGSANSGGVAAGGPKPLNTGGDAYHIAEQPLLYNDGGLTGHQPVGEVKF